MIIPSPRTALFALSLCTPLLASCERAAPPQSAATATSAAAPQTALGRAAASAVNQARVELASENINLNGELFANDGPHDVVARVGHKSPADPRPDAELTPAGELLIDEKQVPVTAAQHEALVQYRKAIMSIAETGMNLGVQGADLGGKAIGEVFEGVMSGHTEQIDKNINAAASKIEAQAMQLCQQLRPLHDMQQQLATSVPQFAPYATLKASDIEDCGKHHDAARHAASSSGSTSG